MLDRVSWSDVADYLPAAFGAMLGLSYAKNQTPKQKVVSFLSAFGLAVYLGAAIAELLNLGPKATIAVGVLTAVVGMNSTRPVVVPVFFQACGTLRGKKAQLPGPPLLISVPILKVNSPSSTQATSSLSRCR